MFTGIIEATGEVKSLVVTGKKARLILSAGIAKRVRKGESLSVDGVCLTVAEKKKRSLSFDLSTETLRVTALGEGKRGDKVNLERPLRVGDRIGGHLVQGHADGVGRIAKRGKEGNGLYLEIRHPSFLNRYIIPRGSIAVQGVSLTVARKGRGRFAVFLIPETLKRTTLGRKKVGEAVTLEADLLVKLIKRHNR